MILGPLFQVLGALAFTLSSVFAKLVHQQAQISALEVTFVRFLVGSAALGGWVLARRLSIRPVRAGMVALRAVSNLVAMILFYLGIQYSTVTTANLLNLTSPVYVFLLAPLINRERSRLRHFLFLGVTLAGIWLVVVPAARGGGPALAGFNPADLFSFFSGVAAALSMTSLREARKNDPTYLILFYLMTVGLVINGALVAPWLVLPPARVVAPLLLSAVCGILGQLLITISFRYMGAQAGSLLSTSRILFAAVLGALLFSEAMTLRIVAGGALILFSLVGSSGVLDRRLPQR